MLWVQQGTADYSDRGISICTDENANVYVTGQFSDTITFDQTHNYNLYNAIFVVKFDAGGNEQWFRAIAGGVTNIAHDIEADMNGHVYLTGDFTGGLQFLPPINQALTNPHTFKVFAAKLTTSGDLDWSRADGSNSEVSSRGIDVKGNSVMFAGNFKCTFSEYADLYGQGTFNSIGFADCFVTSYDINGNRQWAKQWGSSKADKCTDIAIDNNGIPTFTGSSSKNLIVPSPTSTLNAPIHQLIANYGSPNSGYCSSPNYSEYAKFIFAGIADIFTGKLIDPLRELYDYYYRTGSGCLRPFVSGCLTASIPLVPYTGNCAPNNLEFCDHATLITNTNTNEDNLGGVGPNYIFNWSIGSSTTNYAYVTNTGTYSVIVNTEDLCYSFTDDIYVIIHPNQPRPLITDDVVINNHAFYPLQIELCFPDTALLTGTPIGNLNLYSEYKWISNPSFDTTLSVTVTDSYGFEVWDINGCYNSNQIYVIFHQPLAPIVPEIACLNDIDLNDSVDICEGSSIQFQVIDTILNSGCIPYLNGTCLINDSMYVVYFANGITGYPCSPFQFTPTIDDTIYSISCHLQQVNICDTVIYDIHDSIFVNINPNPIATVSINGPNIICDGDSTLITASGNGTILWTMYPSTPVYTNGVDSVIINQTTQIYVSVILTDSNGCYGVDYATLYVQNPQPPLIYTNPLNGLICPFLTLCK